ncbi:MAG: four helix bundle protein [Bacteroidota bacterium]|nr:four helix bundle protein [Bacteroidota bacterium]
MAVDLSGEVDELTFSFPKREQFILTPQIKRATDSIALNIAEGSTGQTTPEFKKFLGYSLRSAIEVIGCLYLGKRRKIISDESFTVFYDKTVTRIKSIQALRNSLK